MSDKKVLVPLDEYLELSKLKESYNSILKEREKIHEKLKEDYRRQFADEISLFKDRVNLDENYMLTHSYAYNTQSYRIGSGSYEVIRMYVPSNTSSEIFRAEEIIQNKERMENKIDSLEKENRELRNKIHMLETTKRRFSRWGRMLA